MDIDDEDNQGWGLADAIEALKADLAAAAVTRTSYPKFPVTSATVELKVVATRSKTGKPGSRCRSSTPNWAANWVTQMRSSAPSPCNSELPWMLWASR